MEQKDTIIQQEEQLDSLPRESTFVALGTVDEDERVCGKQYCCKKRKCCTKLVYVIVFLDWIYFVYIILACAYVFSMSIDADT